MLGGNYEKFRLYIIKYKYIINNNRSNIRNMWVIVEKNEDKKDRSVELQYFNHISIKMIKYIIKSKREGKKIRCVK